jgi:hypothetical protein
MKFKNNKFNSRSHNLVLSLFMTYQQVCNKSNTTGAIYAAGTAYPSGAPEFTPGFLFSHIIVHV